MISRSPIARPVFPAALSLGASGVGALASGSKTGAQ